MNFIKLGREPMARNMPPYPKYCVACRLIYFHRGLRKCFADYELLFDSPVAADLIILCWVIHPPTFQPPVDGARFYRRR